MRERLVVIDDQISPTLVQRLCGKKIETWRIEDGACVPDRSPIHTRSHGTVCAALAGEFLPEMKLVGISTGGNGGAQVENVCAALEWCLQDGAAVVCMSMGAAAWIWPGWERRRAPCAELVPGFFVPAVMKENSLSPQPIPGP